MPNLKTAVVTGAYGFVGRHVARALERQGVRVNGIGHGSWAANEWKAWGIVEWHQADVTVDALVTYGGEPDAVFHCAGSGSVGFSMINPVQDHQRSSMTTLAVLEYLRMHRPHAVMVLPSSAAVYGFAPVQPIGIAAPLVPASPYGVHKKIAEDLCRSYGEHFAVRSAIVRLFSIYGNGLRKQLLWDACRKLDGGDLRFAGSGQETRDWLHIEDAASLLVTASLRADRSCPCANGGTGAATTIREVLNFVQSALGVSDEPTFLGTTRAGDPVHFQADISSALSWGWIPKRKLQSGVNDYVEWFRSEAG